MGYRKPLLFRKDLCRETSGERARRLSQVLDCVEGEKKETLLLALVRNSCG